MNEPADLYKTFFQHTLRDMTYDPTNQCIVVALDFRRRACLARKKTEQVEEQSTLLYRDTGEREQSTLLTERRGRAHSCTVTPHYCTVTPHYCTVTPHYCTVTPHSCTVTPHSCTVTSHYCTVTPHSCTVTPHYCTVIQWCHGSVVCSVLWCHGTLVCSALFSSKWCALLFLSGV